LKKDLDLMSIWGRQIVPEAVQTSLIKLSLQVYNKLTDTKRGIANVTQWCKREGCWKSVQNISYTLPVAIKSCLIGQKELRSALRKAKADQQMVLDTETITEVNKLSAKRWQKVLAFMTNKKLVSPDELTALKVVCQIPNKKPTIAQCKKLLSLLKKLEEEGFKI